MNYDKQAQIYYEPRERSRVRITPERVFIYALGLGAIGGAIYFTYLGLKNKRDAGGGTTTPETKKSSGTTFNVYNSGHLGDSFPLKRGSRGQRVRQLQQALANIIGLEAMNSNGGIDGIFGKGTENALRLANYPKVISEDLFKQIVDNIPTIIFNPQELAQRLYSFANLQNLGGVLEVLKQIKSVAEYSSVNEAYKKLSLVSKTIVTHLLDTAFAKDYMAKDKIKGEFLRMGLKYSTTTGKWSLLGLGQIRDIITIVDTYVVDRNQNRIKVKRNTILGDEQKLENGMTLFRAIDNTLALVPSAHVRYV